MSGAGGRTKRRTHIAGQFAPRLIDMLRSPAYRILNQSEHRVLARLEIELADHGGTDNGKLPCTFDDFVEYGISRECVGPSLRAVEALGFIETTERGRAGNAEWRKPNLFRITFRPTAQAGSTDEWRKIESMEQAKFVAAAARKASAKPLRKTNPQCGNPNHGSVRKSEPQTPDP